MRTDDPAVLAARLCAVRNVANHADGRQYELTPVVVTDAGDALAAQIAGVCNEELVYRTLFAELLDGRAYSDGDAHAFLEWAMKGWEEGTHFVYLLLDGDGRVAGAIDIKSAELASAEIGYWLSRDHRGAMTNAVQSLMYVARDAGYRALHALVRPENERSAAVLERAGFTRSGEVERNGRSYRRYECALSNHEDGPAR